MCMLFFGTVEMMNYTLYVYSSAEMSRNLYLVPGIHYDE